MARLLHFGLWQRAAAVIILTVLGTACLESRADEGMPPAKRELAKQVIVRNKCGTCHTLQAEGLKLKGKVGPDLTHQARRGRSPDWLGKHITDPASIPERDVLPAFEDKRTLMPKFNKLSDRELNALTEFLSRLN